MQPEWLLIIPAVFGLGFLAGYLVRAIISRRRRRRLSRQHRRQVAGQNPLRLARPPGQEDLFHSHCEPHLNSGQLRSTGDAPSLAVTDLAAQPEVNPAIERGSQ